MEGKKKNTLGKVAAFVEILRRTHNLSSSYAGLHQQPG